MQATSATVKGARSTSLHERSQRAVVSQADAATKGTHPIQHEQITWCTAEHKPDADTTVMLSLEGLSEPTSVGYWNGEDWIDCTGMPVTEFVASWAHMPAGFFPALKGKHSRRT